MTPVTCYVTQAASIRIKAVLGQVRLFCVHVGVSVMQSEAKHPPLRYTCHGIPRKARNDRLDGTVQRPCCHAERSEASPSDVRSPWDSSQARNDIGEGASFISAQITLRICKVERL